MSAPSHPPHALELVQREMAKVIVGQSEMVEQLFLTIICEGHSLLEGVAGLGRWLAVQSLAKCLGLEARKLRCSPDLDVNEMTGVASRETTVANMPPAPLQSNLVLVEQIDRLAPRTANVLQQAMQERTLPHHVRLPDPFVVFATRVLKAEQPAENPRRHDDRFLFKIAVSYPAYHDEFGVSGGTQPATPASVAQVLTPDELSRLKEQLRVAEAPPSVIHFAIRMVRATRVHEGENLDFVYEWVVQGAGPRAARDLMLAANARAIIRGRSSANHEDVAVMAYPTLRHRIVTNRNARANGITVDRVIQRLLEDIPPRILGDDQPPKKGDAFNIHNWVPRE